MTIQSFIKVALFFLLSISSQITAQEYLLGNWNGTRSLISEYGIDFEFVYKGEYFNNISGGIKPSGTYLDNFDFKTTFDFNKIIDWNGATLFAYLLGNNGGIPNDKVGSIQGISNIATYNTWKLYQFWLEQQFFNNKFSLLVGLYDLNSEFDVRETSGICINPSHGIGAEFSQSGHNGPSIFPNASLTARIKYMPNNNLYFLFGAFDGVSGNPNNPNGTQIILDKNNGLLLASEIGLFNNGNEFKEGFGKYSAGGWYYTSEFEDLTKIDNDGNPFLRNDNYGFYFSAEKFILAESRDSLQGLSTFLRFGIANGNINAIDFYWGFGINIVGLINGRNQDVLGFAIANAHLGEKYRMVNKVYESKINENEMIFEAIYSLKLLEYLEIKSDFQIIVNPTHYKPNETVTVFGIRTEIEF